MGEQVSHKIGRLLWAATGIRAWCSVLRERCTSSAPWRASRLAIRRGVQIAPLPLGSLAAIAFLLLPSVLALPIDFALGAWAPLPRLAVSLNYRYDALSHMFAFLTAVVVGSILLSPGTLRMLRREGVLLLLLALFTFGHYTAIVDLVALYAGWEASGWIAWLILRHTVRPGGQIVLPLIAHVTGYGLLAAVVVLVSANARTAVAAIVQPELLPVPLLLLLLIPVAARAGQFPFHGWLGSCARAPAAIVAALLAGFFASSGPYLLARAMQIAGGTWPATWRSFALEYALAAVMIASLLAWRTRPSGRALVHAASADLALVLVALIIGTPASLAAGLLLLANTSLALAALLLAPTLTAGASGGRSMSWARGERLVIVAAAASLIGAPPLLGFIARWQLLAALWNGGMLGPLIVLAVATIPRTLALLRAVAALLAVSPSTPAETPHVLPATSFSGASLPAVLVIIFSAMPWLPHRYLVGPAVAAITGIDQVAPHLPTSGPELPGPAMAAMLLLAALALAAYGDPVTRQALALGGEVLRLPAALGTMLRAAGRVCEGFATVLLTLAERATVIGWRLTLSATDGACRAMGVVMPGLEDRYYTGATFLIGIAAILAFVG